MVDDVIEEDNLAGRIRQGGLQLFTAVRHINCLSSKDVWDGETSCGTETGVSKVNDGICTAMLSCHLIYTATGGDTSVNKYMNLVLFIYKHDLALTDMDD